MNVLLHSWYVKGKGKYELRLYNTTIMLTRITSNNVYREYEAELFPMIQAFVKTKG